MRRQAVGRWGVALLAIGMVAAAPPPAQASEYPLESVSFLTEAEVEALRKLPAATTHDAGRALATPAQRRRAARSIKLPLQRLAEVGALFDLMRIRGVGARMARLLSASGVPTCAALGKQEAEPLARRMAETNAREQISQKVPDATILANWIEQARSFRPQFKSAR